MNYQLNSSGQGQQVINTMCSPAELENQLSALLEWKQKAMVQLEHFRLACRLYNLCDANEVNHLLDS